MSGSEMHAAMFCGSVIALRQFERSGTDRTGTPSKSSHNETPAPLLSVDLEEGAGGRRAVVVQGCMVR